MSSPLRFGLVGAGMMGREHIRNLKLIPEVTLAALADPHGPSLESAAAEWGAPVATYADAGAMAAAGPLDAVIVASPNFTHRATLEPLLATDAAILCEKPLCTTVADARWVEQMADARKALFWTGMEYRYMPPATRFIDRVHAGETGRPVMLSIREHRFPFLVKVADWNRFSRNTGGTMVEKCCHFFDLMRFILRAEPVRVFCSGAMDVNHLDERYGGETPDIIDNSYTVVDFEGGARAMLDLSMFAEGEEQQEAIAVVGDKAKLEVTIPAGEIALSPRVGLREPKRVSRERVAVDAAALKAGSHHGATYYQLTAFLDALRRSAAPAVSAKDGLMAVAMGAAAETSAREKRVVTMAEVLG